MIVTGNESNLPALAKMDRAAILTFSPRGSCIPWPLFAKAARPFIVFRRLMAMVEALLIDLKALLVEREDCDAGTVQQLRNGLAQGKTQYRTLRDVTEVLKKKLEGASGAVAKRLHLKLGISSFFLGHLGVAVENLKQAEGALASFFLGRALLERHEHDEALKAFDRAEKAGYTA